MAQFVTYDFNKSPSQNLFASTLTNQQLLRYISRYWEWKTTVNDINVFDKSVDIHEIYQLCMDMHTCYTSAMFFEYVEQRVDGLHGGSRSLTGCTAVTRFLPGTGMYDFFDSASCGRISISVYDGGNTYNGISDEDELASGSFLNITELNAIISTLSLDITTKDRDDIYIGGAVSLKRIYAPGMEDFFDAWQVSDFITVQTVSPLDKRTAFKAVASSCSSFYIDLANQIRLKLLDRVNPINDSHSFLLNMSIMNQWIPTEYVLGSVTGTSTVNSLFMALTMTDGLGFGTYGTPESNKTYSEVDLNLELTDVTASELITDGIIVVDVLEYWDGFTLHEYSEYSLVSDTSIMGLKYGIDNANVLYDFFLTSYYTYSAPPSPSWLENLFNTILSIIQISVAIYTAPVTYGVSLILLADSMGGGFLDKDLKLALQIVTAGSTIYRTGMYSSAIISTAGSIQEYQMADTQEDFIKDMERLSEQINMAISAIEKQEKEDDSESNFKMKVNDFNARFNPLDMLSNRIDLKNNRVEVKQSDLYKNNYYKLLT